MHSLGQVVILNGAPRSGKSGLAERIQREFEGDWIVLGVDAARKLTPERLQPGIGLRPGGERPDLEAWIQAHYTAIFETIAAHSRHGINVVSDFGIHDGYSRPLGIWARCAQALMGHPVLLVGVRCPLEIVMDRRRRSEDGAYLAAGPHEEVPAPVQLWQSEVHRPGIYDVEVDTHEQSRKRSLDVIRAALRSQSNRPAIDRFSNG